MADFTPEEIQKVWEKGFIVIGYDSKKWRKDQCWAWINRNQYGNRHNDYGWECDHVKPESKGGSDALYNIRPLHWQNNASRQTGRLKTVVTSDGNKNVVVG